MTTMTNVKPAIPREVADAVERKRNRPPNEPPWTNEDFATAYSHGIGDTQRILRSIPFDTLMAALVNGYDVEQTDEERAHEFIRDWYAGLQKIQRNCQRSLSLREMAFARANTIQVVLDTLGIKLPEVNA